MERTWRWFGKKDKITLAQLRQIGVEGIVTALHDALPIWYIMQGGHNALNSNLLKHGKSNLILLAKPTPCSFHIVFL